MTSEEIREVNIGDNETDKLCKGWLKKALDDTCWHHCGESKVIEFMAGYGRNYPVYKDMFKKKVLMDGSY